MLWRVRGRLVSWVDSSVGIQSRPSSPRRPAVRSTRIARGMSGFRIRQVAKLLGTYMHSVDACHYLHYIEYDKAIPGHAFPGHPWDEKILQRQIGVGTLVSSKERRALAVALMKH